MFYVVLEQYVWQKLLISSNIIFDNEWVLVIALGGKCLVYLQMYFVTEYVEAVLIYMLYCLSIFNCFSSICIWKLIIFSSTNDKDSSLQPINYAFSKSARFKQAERGFPSSILSTFYSSFGVLHYADIRQRNGNSAFQ